MYIRNTKCLYIGVTDGLYEDVAGSIVSRISLKVLSDPT
jgi:hypothetical protein